MKRLTGSKKVFAVAGAVFLVAAASGSALAMIDHGFGSTRSQQVQREIRQNSSGQAQQSPLPAPTNTPESHGNEVEFRGTVDVIAATGWVIGGRTVQVTGDTEVGSGVDVGSQVKVHAQVQADGSLWAREIKLVQAGGDDGHGNGNENENDDSDNGNGNVNSNADDDDNDDHGNGNGNMNSNDNDDDHGNGNDDHGGTGNDDNGNNDHGGND